LSRLLVLHFLIEGNLEVPVISALEMSLPDVDGRLPAMRSGIRPRGFSSARRPPKLNVLLLRIGVWIDIPA
jgi:hypothetical protein